ncbi:MAG TPA: HAMP domain-containing sensor histidine kinase [Opitutaceae bacterium]
MPRRITLYWLLLLLPTLAVGAGVFVLLRREQARLAERAAATEAIRRTAVEARVQLVAENAALLVDEMQQGLLATLRGLPAADLDAALDELERGNPLVRATFRCRPDGALLRPREGRGTSPEGLDFQRRFAHVLAAEPPWLETAALQERRARAAALEADASRAQQRALSNVSQLQSAREEARQVSKIARASRSYDEERKAEAPERSALADMSTLGRDDVAPATPVSAAATQAPDRSGWLPVAAEGRLFVLGWLQPGGQGEVRGVELELNALVARFASVLPAEVESGERYALLDANGRVLHEVGGGRETARAAPAVRLALTAALPQWQVAGWLNADPYSRGSATWFAAATVLVALLVLAILAGGSLLLWQARRSEAEAAQKTSFVANVSHEFKTPLTTIRLYAELLAQGRVRETAKQADYLQTIGRETQRLARLVNNVLDFSRLEQGRKKYQREQLDVVAVLAALLDAHEPRLTEAGLGLVRTLPTGPLPVTTDRDALEQIVLNLLDNACKYAAAGGEVTVEAAPGPPGGAEVRVLDRGPGVPAAHRDRIFEKFHRVDDALTAEKGGAGLGLSIARQLARGLGGELRYEAHAGGGASFVLTLP